jgi:hypothetical protein
VIVIDILLLLRGGGESIDQGVLIIEEGKGMKGADDTMMKTVERKGIEGNTIEVVGLNLIWQRLLQKQKQGEACKWRFIRCSQKKWM